MTDTLAFDLVPDDTVHLLDTVAVDDGALDALIDEPDHLPRMALGLLSFSILGLVTHGIVVGVASYALPKTASVLASGTPWLWMPIAFVAAFIGTLCICLPSFWFYTQLAGLDASFQWVSTQALRVQAHASVLLFGTLPVFAAVVFWGMLTSDPDRSTGILYFGMALPFITGLFGIRALYRAFRRFVDTKGQTITRRGAFLLRLVAAWGGLYTFVAPVALWRLCQTLSGLL